MVGLERMLDYRGIRLQKFHCIHNQLQDVVDPPLILFPKCTAIMIYHIGRFLFEDFMNFVHVVN